MSICLFVPSVKPCRSLVNGRPLVKERITNIDRTFFREGTIIFYVKFFIGKGVIIHQPTGIVGELAGENPVALVFGPWQNLEIKKNPCMLFFLFF